MKKKPRMRKATMPALAAASKSQLETPSTSLRERIETAAGLGMTVEEICILEGTNRRELYSKYKAELSRGIVKADAKVVASLFKIATGNTAQAASAAMFWTKVRRRWHEVQRVIHGFDPSQFRVAVQQIARVIRENIKTCPHCKKALQLGPKISEELRQVSAKLIEQLPSQEVSPKMPEEGIEL